MMMKAFVAGERVNSYQGKKGAVTERFLICMDSDQQNTLANTFDYAMTADEEKQFTKEKLHMQPITISVGEIRPDFGGRLRMRGAIVEAVGKPAQPAK